MTTYNYGDRVTFCLTGHEPVDAVIVDPALGTNGETEVFVGTIEEYEEYAATYDGEGVDDRFYVAYPNEVEKKA